MILWLEGKHLNRKAIGSLNWSSTVCTIYTVVGMIYSSVLPTFKGDNPVDKFDMRCDPLTPCILSIYCTLHLLDASDAHRQRVHPTQLRIFRALNLMQFFWVFSYDKKIYIIQMSQQNKAPYFCIIIQICMWKLQAEFTSFFECGHFYKYFCYALWFEKRY